MADVRVIIPTYNRARLIPEALASVCAQSVGDLDIVVVDDGSTDDTADVVRALARGETRIRYVPHVNEGAACARNAALQLPGQFSYAAFLDSDDVWCDRLHLERALDIFRRHPSVGLTFARFETMDHTGRHWTDSALKQRQARLDWPLSQGEPDPATQAVILPGPLCLAGFVDNNIGVLTSTVVIRCAAISRPPWFDQRLRTLEDLHLFARLAAVADFGYLSGTTCRARYYGDNLTAPRDLGSRDAVLRWEAQVRYAEELCTLATDAPLAARARRRLADAEYVLGHCQSANGSRRLALAHWLRAARLDPCWRHVRSAMKGVAHILAMT